MLNLNTRTINKKILDKIDDELISVSIATIISNAEKLFGWNTWIFTASNILDMCIHDKPLKYIEDYIIKNLK